MSRPNVYPCMIMDSCWYCGKSSWRYLEGFHQTRLKHYCKDTDCRELSRFVAPAIKQEAEKYGVCIKTILKHSDSKPRKSKKPLLTAWQIKQLEQDAVYHVAIRKHYGLGG